MPPRTSFLARFPSMSLRVAQKRSREEYEGADTAAREVHSPRSQYARVLRSLRFNQPDLPRAPPKPAAKRPRDVRTGAKKKMRAPAAKNGSAKRRERATKRRA